MKIRKYLEQNCIKCGGQVDHIYGKLDANITPWTWNTVPFVIQSRVVFDMPDGVASLNLDSEPEVCVVKNKQGIVYTREYEIEGEGTCSQCKDVVSWKLTTTPYFVTFKTTVSSTDVCPFCTHTMRIVKNVTRSWPDTPKCSSCDFTYNVNNHPMMKFFVANASLTASFDEKNQLADFSTLSSNGFERLASHPCHTIQEFVTLCRDEQKIRVWLTFS